MPSFKEILEMLGLIEPEMVSRYQTGDTAIINRDIADFRGSILNIGGTKDELVGIGRLQSIPLQQLEDKIYTVNFDKKANPDLVADATSLEAMKELPDKRFDIIYFSGFPGFYATSMQTLFNNAARLLKDDGLVLYKGGNPNSDITELLIQAGFKQGHLFHESRYHPELKRFVYDQPALGHFFLASKNSDRINIEAFYTKFPELKIVVSFLTTKDIAKEVDRPSYDEYPKSKLS